MFRFYLAKKKFNAGSDESTQFRNCNNVDATADGKIKKKTQNTLTSFKRKFNRDLDPPSNKVLYDVMTTVIRLDAGLKQ